MKIYFSFFLLMLIRCGNENPSEAPHFEPEIVALQTSEAKRAYLENIFENDQKLRVQLDDPHLLQAERETIWENIHEVHATNLLKVQKYLEINGHPKKAEVGETTALAPWTVIHHQNRLEIRISFFEPLYAAWLAEILVEETFLCTSIVLMRSWPGKEIK